MRVKVTVRIRVRVRVRVSGVQRMAHTMSLEVRTVELAQMLESLEVEC